MKKLIWLGWFGILVSSLAVAEPYYVEVGSPVVIPPRYAPYCAPTYVVPTYTVPTVTYRTYYYAAPIVYPTCSPSTYYYSTPTYYSAPANYSTPTYYPPASYSAPRPNYSTPTNYPPTSVAPTPSKKPVVWTSVDRNPTPQWEGTYTSNP